VRPASDCATTVRIVATQCFDAVSRPRTSGDHLVTGSLRGRPQATLSDLRQQKGSGGARVEP
jgi:hypothetical protein